MHIKILGPLNTGYTIVWEIAILDDNLEQTSHVVVSSYDLDKLVKDSQYSIKGFSKPNLRGRVRIIKE